MRRLLLVGAAAAVIGCGKKDNGTAGDSTAMGTTEHPDIALADVAGKWNVQLARPDNDSSILTYEINATADTAGWTITFPNREPLPLRVLSVAGDSIVTEVGPYDSALQPGTQVTTRTVLRLRGDRLMGVSEAHYQMATGDSVASFRSRGRKAP